MAKHWRIDVSRMNVAGRDIYLAGVVDQESREIISADWGTIAASALGGAFGGAVFARGVPDVLVIDHGKDYAVVAREAAKLGVEVRTVQPYNPIRNRTERAFRTTLAANRYRFPVKRKGRGAP